MALPSSFSPAQLQQAIANLEASAKGGKADAAMLLATWYLRGEPVRRDLARARRHFERAAELGSVEARKIAVSWLASGTGGTRDWGEALDRMAAVGHADEVWRNQAMLIDRMSIDAQGYPSQIPASQTLSETPLVRRFENFASPAECDLLIELARPALRSAEIGSPGQGRAYRSQVRTCHSMGFPLVAETPFVQAINMRIAAATGTGPAQGEPAQIFRYGEGQEFKAHTDSSPDFANQRTGTFLIYLNDGYEGGETDFPKVGLTVSGRKGDGLFFRSADEQGRPEPLSLHAGLPVVSGEKWVYSRWLRQSPLEY